MNVGTLLVTDAQSAELVQPGKSPSHDPRETQGGKTGDRQDVPRIRPNTSSRCMGSGPWK